MADGKNGDTRGLRITLNVVVLGLAFLGAAAFLVSQNVGGKDGEDGSLGRISLSDDAKYELLATVNRLKDDKEWINQSRLKLQSAKFTAKFRETILASDAPLQAEVAAARKELEQPCPKGKEASGPREAPLPVKNVLQRLSDLTSIEESTHRRILSLPWPPEDAATVSEILGARPYGELGWADYDSGYEFDRGYGPPPAAPGPIGTSRDKLQRAIEGHWTFRDDATSCEERRAQLLAVLPAAAPDASDRPALSPLRRSVDRISDVDSLTVEVLPKLASKERDLDERIKSRAGLLQDQSFVYERYLPTAIIVMAMLGITLPFFSWVFPEQMRELGFRRGLLRYSTVVLLLVTITVLALGHLIEGEVLATLLSGIGSYVVADHFRDSSTHNGSTLLKSTSVDDPPPADLKPKRSAAPADEDATPAAPPSEDEPASVDETPSQDSSAG